MKNGLIMVAVVVALAACDSTPTGSMTEIVLPSPVRSVQSIGANQLTVEVNIDGQVYPLRSSGSSWRGSYSVPTDRELPVSVLWRFGQVPIASYEGDIGPIEDSAALTVRPEDYTTTGTAFDADGDGTFNLQELVNCTNPQDPNNVEVRIPNRGTWEVGINGDTGGTWARYPITNWCGDQLAIDNLMIDQGASLPDGQTGFYWQALHDGEFLYIIVYGEATSSATPYGDSSVFGRDDAIHIYIDGDNSKLPRYDEVNDFHVTIPLLKRAAPATEPRESLILDTNGDLTFDNQGNIAIADATGLPVFVPTGATQANHGRDNDGRIAFGPLSDRLSGNMVFQNGIVNHTQQVYEVRIALDALDISVSQPFGFEIQIDDDIDGGDKDARYGWKHPSKIPGGANVNNTVNNPQFMGTVVLE